MPKTLNEVAQERFKQLKERMRLNFISSIEEETKKISKEKLEKLFDTSKTLDEEEVKLVSNTPGLADAINDADEVCDTLDYIDSLNLPPRLSLAIGLIISGYKTNNKQDIANAITALGEYINGNT